MLATVRHQCCVPEGKLCKSWRRMGKLAVMSDYAAVEMEQDETKGFRPDI
jgi:hypothetical protein